MFFKAYFFRINIFIDMKIKHLTNFKIFPHGIC